MAGDPTISHVFVSRVTAYENGQAAIGIPPSLRRHGLGISGGLIIRTLPRRS